MQYLARKLGVDLSSLSLEAPTKTVEKAYTDPETQADRQSEPEIWETKFVIGTDLVISSGIDGGQWITHKADQVIGAALRHDGHFQERSIDACLEILKGLGFENRRRTFLDIGANIGTHSIHAAKLGFETVVSVEPNPTNFRLLRANVVLNDLEDRICCRNVAISHDTGTMQMEVSPDNFGDHRVITDVSVRQNALGESGWKTLEVRVETLDKLLKQNNIHADMLSLVWIDTQGHEGHVLSGANTLKASECPIVVEFWPYGLKRSGGYDLLRSALAEFHTIVNLNASQPSEIKKCDLSDIDSMYAEWSSPEGNRAALHTDLLLVK